MAMGIKNILKELPISERNRRVIGVSWDIFEMAVVLYLLYASVFYMGQVHVCNDIFKANFGWLFGFNETFFDVMNYTPNNSEIWEHAPVVGT